MPERLILVPWNPMEAAEVAFAAAWAEVEPATMRRWCERYGLGRKVGGRYKVSRLALSMWLNGDRKTLAQYHAGDRTSREVVAYYAQMRSPR